MSEFLKKTGKEPKKSLASRIRYRRRALGISKARLASDAELPRAPVSRYEGRQTKDITVKTLKKLTQALGVSADYLAGRCENESCFQNPRLQKLMKSLRRLKQKDLEYLHKMYLFLLENHC